MHCATQMASWYKSISHAREESGTCHKDQICWSMQSSILGNGKVSGLVTVSALQKSEQKCNVLSDFGTSKYSNNWLEEGCPIWFSNIYLTSA